MGKWRMMVAFMAAAVAISLAGCAGPGPRDVPAEVEEGVPETERGQEGQRERRPPARESSALQVLLQRGESALKRGDIEAALRDFERAQRLAPDTAQVYLLLARAYRSADEPGKASAMAERGLLYCEAAAECAALEGFRVESH